VGDVNSGVKDKYFASACSRPSTVFPRLLTLAQAHLSKIEDGKSFWLSKEIGGIIAMLENEFPATLSLEDQGRFIVGYYQQRYYKYEKIEETV
jgi:CRISPR-associated protein Csd1